MKPILRTVFCLGLCWLAAIAPAQTIPGKGESAFRNGNFSGAAIHWQAALEELASSPEQPEYAEILRKLGRAYHALGRHGEAEACLLLALSSALPANLSKPNQKRWCHGLPRPLSNDSTANEEALALAALSEVYRLTEKNAQAKERARQAVEKAGSDFRIQAAVFNQSGNSHTISDEEYYDYEAAIEAYQKAAHFARQAGDERLLANILLNIAQVMADDVDRPLEKKKSSFNHAWQAVEKLKEKPESSARKILPECKSAANPVYDYARHLIHLGQIAWLMQKSYPKAALFKSKGSNALIEAQCFAAVFPRIGSYANAYLGRLYLAEGEEAHSYTRQAIFFAQQLQSADMLYRWELQLGQVLRDSGDIENAIKAYQRAFFYMQKLRAKVAVTRHHGKAKSFRETEEGRISIELADLLLRQAGKNPDGEKQACPVGEKTYTITPKQCYIRQAIAVVEEYKRLELENYLGEACPGRGNNQSFGEAAVLYPLFFSSPGHERIELLLHLPTRQMQTEHFIQKTVKIDSVEQFKENLEELSVKLYARNLDASDEEFRKISRYFHQQLIAPLEPEIEAAGIKVLAVIADGPLRQVPFSALYDGKEYLVEKDYSLATTPSLGFTKLNAPESIDDPRTLVGSLPLFYGENIARLIKKHSSNMVLIKGEHFTKENLEKSIRASPYAILHLDTHGDSDERRKFFLLFHGGKHLYPQGLREMVEGGQKEAIKLLVLSACKTAVGDDRAMLGLSGIAIKAGALSTLASLWEVDAKATCYLMAGFYDKLLRGKTSVVKALQLAQRHMLRKNGEAYWEVCGPPLSKYNQHPAYWSGFSVIGNWKVKIANYKL